MIEAIEEAEDYDRPEIYYPDCFVASTTQKRGREDEEATADKRQKVV